MALIVIAALNGLFGSGWASEVEAHGADGVSVRYARFGRAHAPLELEVEWLASAGEATLSIERAYLAEFSVEQVWPAPAAVTIDPERVHYTFRVARPNERVTVSFELRARHGGRFAGSVGVGEGAGLRVRHFLFP
jgi:hypothetical protein